MTGSPREWLDRDPRLRASIVVPMQNPELAVDEIERCRRRPALRPGPAAGDPANTARAAQNWPIYAAAQRHGLPVGIHAGSSYRHPITPVGWPTYYTEDYVNQAQARSRPQLTSLIGEGVFTKFPDLTFVLMESGFTWLPAYLWRLTKFWQGLRREVPWVTAPPTDHRARTVRLTLQPFDAPPDPATVHATDRAHGLGRDCCCSPPTTRTGSSTATRRCPRALTRRWRGRSWSTTRCAPTPGCRETVHMNVDVLNRAGVAAGGAIAAGHRRLRHPSPPAGAASAG